MSVPIRLEGKVALVTGASRAAGIGAAVVRLLAQAGADVFFTYYTPFDLQMPWKIQEDEPRQLLEQVQGLGRRAERCETDLSDPAAPASIFDQAEAALGPVDILINNAAYDIETDIHHLTAAVLDQHYAVNMRGTALLCAEFARRHAGRPYGRIINLVSGELVGPMPDNLPYVMTKGAIDALTISLSGSLASQGVTVNAVDPGATDTGWMTPEFLTQWTQQAPFGRVGNPQDAAHLILFLASPLGGWITGQILHSRGGQ